MKPTATREEAITLFKLLAGKGFVKARNIPMNSRKIRAVCTQYPQHFLSTQQGYKLVRDATGEEIKNAVADLRSRCRHMAMRADELEKALTPELL